MLYTKTVMPITTSRASTRRRLIHRPGRWSGLCETGAAPSGGFFNRDLIDLDGGRVAPRGVALGDGHEDVHTFDDLPEDAVLVVEPGRGDVRDEELAAVSASAGVRHREHTGLAVLQRRMEFVGEFVAGAARAGA